MSEVWRHGDIVMTWRGDASVPRLFAGNMYLGKVIKWLRSKDDNFWHVQLAEKWISKRNTKEEAQAALVDAAVKALLGTSNE